MKISRTNGTPIHYLAVIGLIISIFCLKPMTLGYSNTDKGLALLVFSSFIIFTSSLKPNKLLLKQNIRIGKYILVTYIPIAVLSLSQGSEGIISMALVIISTIIVGLIFSYSHTKRIYFNIISILFVLIIISSAITFLLSFYIPIDKLKFVEFDVRNRSDFDKASVYYPFSMLYTFFTTTFFAFPRFNFYFIEAGIAPCFFSSLLFINQYRRRPATKIVTQIVFSLGGLLSFSTSFVPAFAIGFIGKYIQANKITITKIFILIAFAAIGYWAFRKIPYFGYDAKSMTHGSSFDARVSAVDFNESNLLRIVRIFSATILLYKLIIYKKKINFYVLSIFLPIYFSGLINVTFYSTIFITFCYLSYNIFSGISDYNIKKSIYHNKEF